MFYDNNINPDLIEIILQNIFHQPVTSGRFASMIQLEHFKNGTRGVFPYEGKIFFRSKDILDMANVTNGLDYEVFLEFYKELLPENYNSKTYNIVQNTKDRLKLSYVNLDIAKFTFDEHIVLDLYLTQLDKLIIQTNNLSAKELGERIILMPANIPSSFEELKTMFSTLIPTKINLDDFENSNSYIFNLDIDEKLKFMRQNNLFFNENNQVEQQQLDITYLNYEKLEKYHETYDLVINVDRDHRQLYTRGRFFINMFIELNDSIKTSIIKPYYSMDNNDIFNIFLGEKIGPVLKNYAILRKDVDNYPVFSRLYTDGSLINLIYPPLFCDIEIDLCYERIEERINYTLHLYEGNNGLIYIIVVLEDTDCMNFIKYIKTQKCIFDLFLHQSEFNEIIKKQYLEYYDIDKSNLTIYLFRNHDLNFNVSFGNSKFNFSNDIEYFKRQHTYSSRYHVKSDQLLNNYIFD